MDFTLKIYKQFLHSLLANDYSFQTLENFIQHPNKEKIVILRHDVDRLPENALKMARMEKLRKLYPVKTICMHGSPLSKWDNRDLWKKYDYRHFGIIAEPYFDIDFSDVFYLTDTGRSWNNSKVSIRDKINAGMNSLTGMDDSLCEGWIPSELGMDRMGSLAGTDETLAGWKKTPRLNTLEGDPVQWGREGRNCENTLGNLRFRSMFDIILAAERGLLPDKIMINVHPQRWTDNPVEWTKELVWQNVKNVVKRIVVRRLHR